jgi:hypothetical protein
MHSLDIRHPAERHSYVCVPALQLHLFQTQVELVITRVGDKVCSSCERSLPYTAFNNCVAKRDGLQAYCRSCQSDTGRQDRNSPVVRRRKNELHRRYRRERPEWHRRLGRAHRAASRLAAPDRCEDCGRAGPLHAHHDDHDYGQQVEWLCPRCHAGRHPECRTVTSRRARWAWSWLFPVERAS